MPSKRKADKAPDRAQPPASQGPRLDLDHTQGKKAVTQAPTTPQNSTTCPSRYSTPLNVVTGSSTYDRAQARRYPLSADLIHRAYTSRSLIDSYLDGIPDVSEKIISDLRGTDEWKRFLEKCLSGHKTSDSNEKEFVDLIKCIASLYGLQKDFGDPQKSSSSSCQRCIRISYQGNYSMTTWNTQAKWLHGNHASTAKQYELKPDLMSFVVEAGLRPRKAREPRVRPAEPPTILPAPSDWQPEWMVDKTFPIVEWKTPAWECLDVFWECKRNPNTLKDAKVYIDCALKATEALRFQWSRRFIHCFLHCGTMMQLLHFDRSGMMASQPIDITTNTAIFVRCLLAVFYHKPSKLGYPVGEHAPFHMKDPNDNRRLQVVTVGKRQFFIDDQQAGPPRDHLVSRATVAFRAKLINPDGEEKTGWDWCYKSSWIQKHRIHEGRFLEDTQGPGVISLLAYDIAKVNHSNDTTVVGRQQCSSGDAMDIINYFGEQAKKQHADFVQHTGTQSTSEIQDAAVMLLDPRRPMAESQQNCDDKEHRNIVIAWAYLSFDKATSLCDLQTHLSLWRQAFSAVKSIVNKGICHRDISFSNIRVNTLNQVKVCDFDMAMLENSQGPGANDRTGTVAFMPISILGPRPCKHRPVHDCESVFWVCTLSLLYRIGIGETRDTVVNIMGPGQSLSVVRGLKGFLVYKLARVKLKTRLLESLFNLADPKDWSLLWCLTELAREFSEHGFDEDYAEAEEFESTCFDRCIEIIEQSESRLQH